MNFFDRIKARILLFKGNLRDKIICIDNKKLIFSAAGIWVAAFVIIVIVCRIGNGSDISAAADATIVLESDSETETTYKFKNLFKETEAQTTEITTSEMVTEAYTEPPTEPQTTQPETKKQVRVEKETISIDKLEVSKTTLEDDVADTPKVIDVVEVPKEVTVPSDNMDSSRFAHCIDISYHQGKIDWAAVKASGIDYAIIRVGYRGYETGKLGKDIRFDENIQGAINNDIKVGVYFFSQAVTEQEALEEASMTLNYIKNYKISLPVVIDWETSNGYRTECGLSKDKLTKILSVFCDTVKSYGYEPMVYMCKADYLNRINTSLIASKYKVWVAWYFNKYYTENYASNIFKYGDELPELPFEYNIWQYTSKGNVKGINGLVDMNVLMLPEAKHDVTLNITNKSIVTNVNEPVDLMNGVSAKNSYGKDATDEIVISITDSKGSGITKEQAFVLGGKYIVNYKYTDRLGTIVRKCADLYVRTQPVVYFENNIWEDNSEKVIIYNYDENKNAADNYQDIIAMLDSKLSARYQDFEQGKLVVKEVTDKTYKDIQSIMADEKISAGEFLIECQFSETHGLSNLKTVRLVINREIQADNAEETTTDFAGGTGDL